ncbi:MAG TPA: hypothetical protein DF637_02610 [Rikenellaceae bacterium]|nr:hypothetical protein [Rikenellaceae bacterium]
MIIPTNYENLEKNLLVLGFHVLSNLKKQSNNLEELFQKLNESNEINLDQYFNVLTFLWIADLIEMADYKIYLK